MVFKKKLKVDILPVVQRLEAITRRRLGTEILGDYRSVFRGQGLEFDSYRSYTPDDDAGMIDWKASAKAKELLVKQYIETRALDVFFLIDISQTMVFGSTPKLKNEYVVELVAALAYAVMGAGDRVGFATFREKIVSEAKPSRGSSQFYRIISSLLDPDAYGGIHDFNKGFDFLLKFVKFIKKIGGVYIIISDFIGLKPEDEEWQKKIKMLQAMGDVIMIMVKDPRDRHIPADTGLVMIEDPHSGKRMLINSRLVKHRYEHLVKREEELLKQRIKEIGVDFLSISTDEDFIKKILVLFTRRRAVWT